MPDMVWGAEVKPGRGNCVKREECEQLCLFPGTSRGIVSAKERGCRLLSLFVF